MQLMVEGDLWEIFVPSELGYSAYHSNAHDGIDHSDVTIFKIWLVEILGETADATDRCDVISLVGCNDKLKTYIENSLRRYKSVHRMKLQVRELKKKMHGHKVSAEKKHELHNKIHILELLIEHKENGGSHPSSISDEL